MKIKKRLKKIYIYYFLKITSCNGTIKQLLLITLRDCNSKENIYDTFA